MKDPELKGIYIIGDQDNLHGQTLRAYINLYLRRAFMRGDTDSCAMGYDLHANKDKAIYVAPFYPGFPVNMVLDALPKDAKFVVDFRFDISRENAFIVDCAKALTQRADMIICESQLLKENLEAILNPKTQIQIIPSFLPNSFRRVEETPENENKLKSIVVPLFIQNWRKDCLMSDVFSSDYGDIKKTIVVDAMDPIESFDGWDIIRVTNYFEFVDCLMLFSGMIIPKDSSGMLKSQHMALLAVSNGVKAISNDVISFTNLGLSGVYTADTIEKAIELAKDTAVDYEENERTIDTYFSIEHLGSLWSKVFKNLSK